MQREKILFFERSIIFAGVLLIISFFLLFSRVQAGSKKNIYLFSDNSYSVDVSYKENAMLVAVVSTKSSTLASVKREIRYQNGIIYLNSLNEESLNIYSRKLNITGNCSVNLLHAYCKVQIVNISNGGKFDYGNKKYGKNITFGDNITEWEHAYYCTTQVISDISDIDVVYEKNKKISLNAKLEAPLNGGGKLTYVSDNTNVVTVDDVGNLNIVGVGQTTVTITAAGNGPYLESSKSITVKVNQADQTITYNNVSPFTYGETKTFLFGAKTTGEAGVLYSSDNKGVISVDANGTATIVGAGTANIVITAPKTDNYKQAVVTVPIQVLKGTQAFSQCSMSTNLTYGTADVQITAKTNGDGTITYASNNGAVLTVSSTGKVHTTGAGKAVITVSAGATANYKAAQSKQISVTVNKANQVITVSKTSYSKVKSSKAFSLGASLSGGTSLKYLSSNLKVLKVSQNGVVTIADYGTARVTISADGNANYNAASSKTVSISVSTSGTTIISTTSTVKNQVLLKWNKRTDATGYSIEYSQDSSIPDNNKDTVRVAGETTLSKTITNLKSGKKYYFRIRVYKTANGSTTYSKYSSITNVTVK